MNTKILVFFFLGLACALGKPSAAPTRWGIISAGKISHDFIKSLEKFQSEHKVVAIAARELKRAQDYAKKFKIERSYGSYEELARDSEIDVVYVGVINPYHYPVVKMLLEAGKPVLCEKPLGMNKKQVKEMTDLAKSKNLFFMEALWSRFLPPYRFAMKKIAEGAIGEPKHVNARFTVQMMDVPRLVKKELGGGALIDIGGYAMNTILMSFNYSHPTNVTAFGVLNDDGVDIASSAVFQFPEERLGTITVDIRGEAPSETMILGTKGYIRFSDPLNAPETVTVNGKEHKFSLHEEGYNWDNNSGLRYEADAVRKCLLAGETESPVMTHKHSLQLAELEDEIRKQLGVHYDED